MIAIEKEMKGINVIVHTSTIEINDDEEAFTATARHAYVIY